jgi:DNA-binding NarL/FixJ family response regulator
VRFLTTERHEYPRRKHGGRPSKCNPRCAHVEALGDTIRNVDARTIQIMLCDDDADVRWLLRSQIEQDQQLRVIRETSDGDACLDAATDEDVIVLDISMPRLGGLATLPLLREARPEVGILVLSEFPAEQMACRALELGADAYLEKRTPSEEIRRCIREIDAARSRRRPGAVISGPAG